jgi:hypothetical protein
VGWVSETWGAARGLQVLAVAAFSVALITVVSGRRGWGAGWAGGTGGGGRGGAVVRPQGDGGSG